MLVDPSVLLLLLLLLLVVVVVCVARVQVYKAVLRETGQEVAVKVQRPGVEPLILRDLFIFRGLGSLFNTLSQQRLGCNAELIVDEFGEKLLEELDYRQVGSGCVCVWGGWGEGEGGLVGGGFCFWGPGCGEETFEGVPAGSQ
jgi:hypothetical protein